MKTCIISCLLPETRCSQPPFVRTGDPLYSNSHQAQQPTTLANWPALLITQRHFLVHSHNTSDHTPVLNHMQLHQDFFKTSFSQNHTVKCTFIVSVENTMPCLMSLKVSGAVCFTQATPFACFLILSLQCVSDCLLSSLLNYPTCNCICRSLTLPSSLITDPQNPPLLYSLMVLFC